MDENDKNPSVYSRLYWLIQEKKVEPEGLLTLLEFYWPTFIQINNCVFLKEKFSKESYKQLIEDKSNPEYWTNLVTVNDFFLEADNSQENSTYLAKTLVEMWSIKLANDFPSMSFVVEYLEDKENGDLGLTFYQVNKN